MPNIYLEGWARGVPALALSHDPDGVIARERIGAFAAGSAAPFAQLAATMWEARDQQAEIAARCRSYVEREHSPEDGARRWREALGFGAAQRAGAEGVTEPPGPSPVRSAGRRSSKGRGMACAGGHRYRSSAASPASSPRADYTRSFGRQWNRWAQDAGGQRQRDYDLPRSLRALRARPRSSRAGAYSTRAAARAPSWTSSRRMPRS